MLCGLCLRLNLVRDDVLGSVSDQRGVGRLGVAHVIVPVEDDVAGNVVEKLRRTGADRILMFALGTAVANLFRPWEPPD
jgi:hypothetical protein